MDGPFRLEKAATTPTPATISLNREAGANIVFGYRVEQDFDLAKEQRRDRLWWVLIAGGVLWSLYLWSGAFHGWTERPFVTEILQGWLATSLFYGDNFYVRRKADLSKLWLWKAIIATIPFHALYLAFIFWSDRAFPHVMTKIIVFFPVLTLGFAIESVNMQRLIDHFKPASSGDAGVAPTDGRFPLSRF